MNIRRPKEKVAIVGVFLVPLLLVKGGASLLLSGPAEAQATPRTKNKKPPVYVAPDPPSWTPQQVVAAGRIAALKTEPFGPSPLFHLAAPTIPDQPDKPPPDTRPDVPPPDVVVQVILTRSDGNHIALIDRKRYQVGDALGDQGWFIVKIDGPGRAVVIEHQPSERTATLLVPLPR